VTVAMIDISPAMENILIAIGEGYSIAYMITEAKRLVIRTSSGLSITSANSLPDNEFLSWVMGRI